MTATRRPAWRLQILAVLALSLLELAPPSAMAEPVSQAIFITNGQVPPNQRLLKATQQALVRLEWSADRPMSVHLEGYDITVVVRPDKPALMQFKAHAAGRFAVHAHEGERQGPSSGHAHGRGALLRLEVHPQ